jgi:hypothetical protein
MMLDVDSLEAGLELNALLAERIMGWPVAHYIKGKRYPGFNPKTINYYESTDNIKRTDFSSDWSYWSPSTNIKDAWDIVEKLRAMGDGHFTLLAFTTNWRAGWDTPEREDVYGKEFLDERYGFGRFVVADTAPLAICRAALAYIEGTAPAQITTAGGEE